MYLLAHVSWEFLALCSHNKIVGGACGGAAPPCAAGVCKPFMVLLSIAPAFFKERGRVGVAQPPEFVKHCPKMRTVASCMFSEFSEL